MSAQETTPRHASSTALLMASITSKPRADLALGTASFSLTMVSLLSNNTDASHPCTHQSTTTAYTRGSYRNGDMESWRKVYIHEAVVEMESDEARRHPGVGDLRLQNDVEDDVRQAGACHVRGVDLTCARSVVRPLTPPYLRQTDFPRRVGHVGGPVVRGREDVAAKSTSAISFFFPWKTFSRCPIRVLKMRSCAESLACGDVRLVPSGGSGTDRIERSSGEELTGLSNSGDLAEGVNSGTNPGDLAERVNSGTNLGDLAERVNSGTNPGDLAKRVNSGINPGDLAEMVGMTSSDSSSSIRVVSSPGSGEASRCDPEVGSSGVSLGPPLSVDVRVLRDLEIMKADHDLDTTVTEGSLAVIRERYNIPVEYGLHVP
ncbi:hypothetical protein BHM03_00009099 [Ensete ventricosum]|nr:hypothetical protein BHM03_00009099 [Ensete ventricosum]